MPKVVKIKRGLDIRLKGKAELQLTEPKMTGLFAIKPTDFKGLELRVLLKPGDPVKTGTPVLADKLHPEIVLVSPVAGIVEAVNRGERRKLLEVVIREEGAAQFEPLKKGDPTTMTAEEVKTQILQSGLWPSLVQRPFGVVARTDAKPRSVIVSAFDSAPLGPDYDFILKGKKDAFRQGVKALRKLTEGTVYLSIRPEQAASEVFSGLEGVEYIHVTGPHPSGNPGVQLHHVNPVNKGEVVWTVNPQLVAAVGDTFINGHYNPERIVALSGSRVKNPGYMKIRNGAQLTGWAGGSILDGETPSRIISGNVLTGTAISGDGFIGYYDSLVTVIPEGNYFDLFGWAMPGLNKFSMSRTFASSLIPKKVWDLDTNLKGGHRAFVVTGQYEKVLPMDIYPVHLLKAILANDIDKMEQLGIYEVVEEDMALCEFVCTSKMDVQEILRSGLDLVRKEMS